MGKTLSSIQEYATIAFTLLGILFGMLIIAFIFGQLGKSNISALDDNTITREGVTGAFINITIYTIPEASSSNFNGGFSVIGALNTTSGKVIDSGNYTVDSAAGTLINASTVVWNAVTLNYSYSQKTDAKMRTEATNTNSLNAVKSYTTNSNSQFTTISIAIILVILIGVFLLFWKIFVANKKRKESSYGGNFE
jgi:hypothetical protein